MERNRQLTLDLLVVDDKKSDRVGKAIEDKSQLIDTVIASVADHYCVKVEDLLSPSRTADLAEARFMAAYVLYETSGLSYKAIAFALGRTDHTTILHALNRAEELMAQPHFRRRAEEITTSINSNQK